MEGTFTKSAGTYYVHVKDTSGNWVYQKVAVPEATLPAPSISNPTGGNWTKSNFSLTVSTTTTNVELWQYSYDQSNWVTYTNSNSSKFVTTPFSAERNQPVYIRYKSNSIYSKVANTYIRIDKTKPKYTSVAPYCGDPFGDGARHYVRLYFSDTQSGLGVRTVHDWDAHQNVYFPNVNYNGAQNGVDTLANRGSWLGFEHTICDVAGNCNSWNDSRVNFSC